MSEKCEKYTSMTERLLHSRHSILMKTERLLDYPILLDSFLVVHHQLSQAKAQHLSLKVNDLEPILEIQIKIPFK